MIWNILEALMWVFVGFSGLVTLFLAEECISGFRVLMWMKTKRKYKG